MFLLQALLLLRVAVPAAHSMLHGIADVAVEEKASLCVISDAACSDEASQTTSLPVQVVLADVLPAGNFEVNLASTATAPLSFSPAATVALQTRALKSNTPPPKS